MFTDKFITFVWWVVPKMTCMVVFCENIKTSDVDQHDGENLFYEFPKDQELCQKWLKKCGRENYNYNFNNCYICSEHFTEEDFEPDTEREPLSKRKLVPTAIPSLKLSDYQELLKQHDSLKKYLYYKRKFYESKVKELEELKQEIIDLRSQFIIECTQNSNFEEALKFFFTEAQKYFIIGQEEDGKWNCDALTAVLSIKYLSEECYRFLQENLHYPIPDLDSLKKWVMNINFRQGILHEFLSIMQISARELTSYEKITILQFGKMNVQSLYEYDGTYDEVVGPHSYMQIILATGLFAKWKQPIYSEFDGKVTKNILMHLIKKLHGMSYTVVACVSDHNESILDLWKELKVSAICSYFYHPVTGERLYYFVEPPSLLLSIHNILIEKGFTLNTGKRVAVEPLKHLLKSDHKYSSPINEQHLQQIGKDRRNLILATQLFCNDTAEDLKRFSLHPFDALAYSTGVFIENISKWYTMARRSYGSNIYGQNLILTATSEMISKIIVHNNTALELLQKAILVSINSLRLFPLELWGKYNIKCSVSTDKLSNNELDILFSQICGEKHQTSYASPLSATRHFQTMFRRENKSGIEIEGQDYLARKILSHITFLESEDNAVVSTSLDHPVDYDTLSFTEDDEVHYLVASVAQKFLNIHPELGSAIENFVEPSDGWAVQARQLNKIFIKFHKKELVSGHPEITKQLIDMVKKLYPDIALDVAKCFLEERLMLRIKHLNSKVKTEVF